MTLKVRPAVYAALFGCIALLVVGLVFVVVQTFGLVSQTRATQEGNRDLLNLIKSCTDPSGECAKRGQEQTADAIADINRVTVYAAACADEPGVQGQSAIYACVVEMLAEDDADGQGG